MQKWVVACLAIAIFVGAHLYESPVARAWIGYFFTQEPYCNVLLVFSAALWAFQPTPPLCACGRVYYNDPFPYAYVCPPNDVPSGYRGYEYCAPCPRDMKTHLDDNHGSTATSQHSTSDTATAATTPDKASLNPAKGGVDDEHYGATGLHGLGTVAPTATEEEEGVLTRGQDESDQAYQLRFFKWFLQGASTKYKHSMLATIAMRRAHFGNSWYDDALENLVRDSLQEKNQNE